MAFRQHRLGERIKQRSLVLEMPVRSFAAGAGPA